MNDAGSRLGSVKKRERYVIVPWICLGTKWGKVIGCGEVTVAYVGSMWVHHVRVVMFNVCSLCFIVFDMQGVCCCLLYNEDRRWKRPQPTFNANDVSHNNVP